MDFLPIVSTTSIDDGLALLLGMYAVFELNFNKNSRAIRLLYAVVFGDKRFLTNTIRNIMHEKNIDVYHEQNQKTSNNRNLISNNAMIFNNRSLSSSQDKLDSSPISTVEEAILSSSQDKLDSPPISTVEKVSYLNDNNLNDNTTVISDK